MSFSVGTNLGAMSALQTLNQTQMEMQQVQSRISSTKKVNGAADNAAAYTIAQKMRADVKGFESVSDSLNNAKSLVTVTLAAGESISDLLNTMKAKALAAKDKGMDASSRAKLQTEFGQLMKQITSIANNASFNKKNFATGTDDIYAITDTTGASDSAIQLTASASTTFTATALSLSDKSIGTQSDASGAAGAIDTAITTLGSILGSLGAVSKRLDLQSSFVGKLTDALEAGIGNLVDADMAKESAKLQALQVKSQLGIQALSIANQSTQGVLSLFR